MDFERKKPYRDEYAGNRDERYYSNRNSSNDHGGYNRGSGYERNAYPPRQERRQSDDRERSETVYSQKVRAGKRRTYFLDVQKTKGDDYYLTVTESSRRSDGDGYVRHKIFLYKEDFNRFQAALDDVLQHIKTELMPDYDYDEFARRYEEQDEDQAPYTQRRTGEGSDFSTPTTETFDDDDSTW